MVCVSWVFWASFWLISTYQWVHTMHILFWLGYLTQDDTFLFHPLKVQSSKSLLESIQSLNCNPQNKTEKQLGKLQTLHLHVWSQCAHKISNSFFLFDGCNKLLSPELAPLLLRSFSLQVSHDSDIINILRSPNLLQLHSFLFQCRDLHMVFWAPPKVLHHFYYSALC
jgi:hypothetical protein